MAHSQVDPQTSHREPIYMFRFSGGHTFRHHALEAGQLDSLDEALIDELAGQGLVGLDYPGTSSISLTPTGRAYEVVEELDRVEGAELTADAKEITGAVEAQAAADNKLAWPAVRPVLVALRNYWEASGFSEHGVALTPILAVLPEERHGLFKATTRELLEGDYVRPGSSVAANGVPGEIVFTARTQFSLAGWPGAEPDELVRDLLAVIAELEELEGDPQKKKRLSELGRSVRDVGTEVAGEVLAKLILGA